MRCLDAIRTHGIPFLEINASSSGELALAAPFPFLIIQSVEGDASALTITEVSGSPTVGSWSSWATAVNISVATGMSDS